MVGDTRSAFPSWVPDRVQIYLHHTEGGISLRALARQSGQHVSTVLRQVRGYENRREDPLLDDALRALSSFRGGLDFSLVPPQHHFGKRDMIAMYATPYNLVKKPNYQSYGFPQQDELEREARRILRRMAEPGAKMVFAVDMDKAVVLRDYPDGRSVRTAILSRSFAQACILQDWICCVKSGRIATYNLSANGRLMLKRLLSADQQSADMFRSPSLNISETPIAVLARRKDRDGSPFLDPALVKAAERLREDFELAQLSDKPSYSWEKLADPQHEIMQEHINSCKLSDGQIKAFQRVVLALQDLGPGLGDVALRVCCHLEGVESAERRMGWAARSGKIVLRITLQRLRLHFDTTYGRAGPMIG